MTKERKGKRKKNFEKHKHMRGERKRKSQKIKMYEGQVTYTSHMFIK